MFFLQIVFKKMDFAFIFEKKTRGQFEKVFVMRRKITEKVGSKHSKFNILKGTGSVFIRIFSSKNKTQLCQEPEDIHGVN